MTVGELMQTSVMTVDPQAPLKNVARILSEFRISGLPVVDGGGAVVGVVSETDILFKEVGGESKRRRLLDRVFASRRSSRRKADAKTAGDAMTSPAITISADASVDEAARLMLARAVNRLPVIEEGRLVGIVARADLVRAFTRSDEEIAEELGALLVDRFWLPPTAVNADISDGHVTVAGEVDSTETAASLEDAIRNVPGVVSVNASFMREAIAVTSASSRSKAIAGISRSGCHTATATDSDAIDQCSRSAARRISGLRMEWEDHRNGPSWRASSSRPHGGLAAERARECARRRRRPPVPTCAGFSRSAARCVTRIRR